ncbi:hypothetical protein P409_27080, partial [Inquilinus limosus MP06]
MTRSSGRGAAGKRSFLPPVVQEFLRNRVRELSGFGIAVFGCGLLVALVSYDPTDPSWNTAKAGPAANLLGRPGAHVADLLIQTLGIGAFLLAVLPLFWAWRLMRHQPLDRVWWRVTSMLFGVLFLAAGLSPLPAIEGLGRARLAGRRRRVDDPAAHLRHRHHVRGAGRHLLAGAGHRRRRPAAGAGRAGPVLDRMAPRRLRHRGRRPRRRV